MTKDISKMDYSEFCQFLAENDERFNIVLRYDDFTVYYDKQDNKFYYLEGGEDDASDFFEVEKICYLVYSAKNDLQIPHEKAGEVLHSLFESDICGEAVFEDYIEYMWFKRVN